MPIEPRNLGIPLHNRNWAWLWFILACLAFAIYLILPVTPVQWTVTLMLMGPTIWLVFVGPSSLYHWQLNHRYSFVGWLVLACRIALFFFVVNTAAPRTLTALEKFVAEGKFPALNAYQHFDNDHDFAVYVSKLKLTSLSESQAVAVLTKEGFKCFPQTNGTNTCVREFSQLVCMQKQIVGLPLFPANRIEAHLEKICL